MLSFEERDLARRMREVGASIVVPHPPMLRGARRAHSNLFAALAAVMTTAIVIVTIAQLDARISNTLGPPPSPSASGGLRATPTASAAASANVSPTPSHRATPYGGVPASTVTAGPRTITGMVYELDARGERHPVGGVRVDVFVYGYGAYHWMTDVTDGTGRYELWGFAEDTTAVIYAAKQSYVQPCAVWVLIAGDYMRDVEIVPVSAGGAAATAAARRGVAPFLTGVVYEQRADGARIPIANAVITLGGDMQPVAATTVTDDFGRYLLCSVRVLPDVLSATAPGYTGTLPLNEVNVVGDITTLDIELKR
jgi:hypothetical protein